MKPDQTFHPSDIFYHLADLAELMQATYDILNEMDRGTGNDKLNRVTGMHSIACREVAKIRDMASIFDGPARWENVSDSGSSEIPRLAAAYKAARAAYLLQEQATDGEAAGKSPEWDAFEAAEDAILFTPCRTMRDVAAKVDAILSDDNLDDTLRNCFRMEGEEKVWSLFPFLRSLKGVTP